MKYCPQCGKEVPVASKFCPSCGIAINGDIPAVSGNPTNSNRVMPGAWLTMGLLLMLCVGGAAYFGSQKGSSAGKNADSSKLTDAEKTLEDSRRSSCRSNLQQIALAALQYSQDYEEKFPPVKVNDDIIAIGTTYGWADALMPYVKAPALFQCVSEPNGAEASPTSKGYVDYYFNSLLGNQSQAAIESAASTIAFGDGVSGNARYARSSFETAGDPVAATRHLDGANYAFADGHIKWIRPGNFGLGKATPDYWAVFPSIQTVD